MIVQVTRLDFAPEHAMSYNELVALIKNNILTSDWGDEDHMESILSDNKSKWNSQMFLNVRWASFHVSDSCPGFVRLRHAPAAWYRQPCLPSVWLQGKQEGCISPGAVWHLL